MSVQLPIKVTGEKELLELLNIIEDCVDTLGSHTDLLLILNDRSKFWDKLNFLELRLGALQAFLALRK